MDVFLNGRKEKGRFDTFTEKSVRGLEILLQIIGSNSSAQAELNAQDNI